MGKKQDLTSSGKDEIVRVIGKEISILHIAIDVKRDHRIKSFANTSTNVRTKGRRGICKATKRSKSLLAQNLKQNPLSTSGKLFCEAGIQNCGRRLT